MSAAIEKFVAYDKSSGRVLSSGTTCNPKSLETAHMGILVGASADPFGDYVIGGQVVKMPPRPSEHHEFNYQLRRWDLRSDLAWADIRSRRSILLSQSDWVVTRSMESGQPVPPQWQAYRQALRDITNQSDPTKISWPAAPA